MKSILYAGAALMIGASIYGFVDYSQASNKKEFNDMYTVAKEKPAVVTLKTDTDQPTKEAIQKEDNPVEKKNDTPVNIKGEKADESEDVYKRQPLILPYPIEKSSVIPDSIR